MPRRRRSRGARAHRIPYVLLVESHDLGPRAQWRKRVKGAVVPRLVRGRQACSSSGRRRASRSSRAALIRARCASSRTPSTSTPGAIAQGCGRLRHARRGPTRTSSCSAVATTRPGERSRRAHSRAAAATDDRRLRVVVAGSGPGARSHCASSPTQLGVAARRCSATCARKQLAAEYVRADVFALLSLHETWGVVVNEAAASGLPLVLSDRVGAPTTSSARRRERLRRPGRGCRCGGRGSRTPRRRLRVAAGDG